MNTTEGQAVRRRPARRRGRWTYNSESTYYGVAGWHLDGTPLVIDFIPGNHQCCNGGRGCCHGCYLLYNWPGREHEPLSMFVDSAMEQVEDDYDALVYKVGAYIALARAWLARLLDDSPHEAREKRRAS